jgi:hypothetical protein
VPEARPSPDPDELTEVEKALVRALADAIVRRVRDEPSRRPAQSDPPRDRAKAVA